MARPGIRWATGREYPTRRCAPGRQGQVPGKPGTGPSGRGAPGGRGARLVQAEVADVGDVPAGGGEQVDQSGGQIVVEQQPHAEGRKGCLLYTSPSPRD